MALDEHGGTNRFSVSTAIGAIILVYGALLVAGGPQWATRQIVAAQQNHGEATPQEAAAHGAQAAPPLWTVLPFAVLLGSIAVLPLIPATEHWWESNRNRFLVAIGLSLIVLAYYALLHKAPLEAHWPAHHVVEANGSWFNAAFAKTVLANAILQEYIPFIVLLFSLYTICGGIRITGDLQAHPMTNATFLAVGALLASFIGTTGAAMLFIRPLLETNRERKHVAHTVVFFIFIVCNCGGCLLPIGDPPLFLGYLQGVPFLWTLVLWKEWLFVNGILVALYLLLDTLWFYRAETVADMKRDVEQIRKLHVTGWQVNVPLLLGVVLAVAVLDPSKPVPGTDWHPWLYLREVVQLGLVALSLALGQKQVRYANRFNYHAIVEVAAIFTGIFITMQPALQILHERGSELGIRAPAQFFWATGVLSSVLDNAPTYLVFFQAAQARPKVEGAAYVAGVDALTLVGISLGAVFMGAMTYIGNGPNFMVRAIAEKAGVKMPSFFGYMAYSGLILIPVFLAMMWFYLLFPYH
ncbi:MAG: sodium:proton antiporter [Pirellulales bacterium]|nr:sodium:proton antiporter [Pirellulales bacterium]